MDKNILLLIALVVIVTIIINRVGEKKDVSGTDDGIRCEAPLVLSKDGTRCECESGKRGTLCELHDQCNYRGRFVDGHCSCDGVFNAYESEDCSCPVQDGVSYCCGLHGTLIEPEGEMAYCQCDNSYLGTNCQHRFALVSTCNECQNLPGDATSATVTCKTVQGIPGGVCAWASVDGKHAGICERTNGDAIRCQL